MDRNTSQRRDIVYCHQCENEWYRDEHGLSCPECQSDFTEIIEADNDPRNDEQHIPADPAFNDEQRSRPDNMFEEEPGPNNDLQWEQTGPDRYRLRATYQTGGGNGRQHGQEQQPGLGGALMGMFGNMLQGMMAPAQPQSPTQERSQTPQSPIRRPSSALGDPNDPHRGGGGMIVRQGQGPGFSYTIASSSSNNFNGNNLFPRNAHGPQPFQAQPAHLEHVMSQIMNNIGVMPGGGRTHMGPGAPAPGMQPFHDPNSPFGPGSPFMIGIGNFGGVPGGPGEHPNAQNPLRNFLNIFGPGGTGVAGDTVYSQEAMDRILSELMEQHQTGNAPGPASAAAIKALPRKTISATDLADSSTGKAECSICMDDVPLGTVVTLLPCAHWFHRECIEAWLGEHDTCPHCRQGIMTKNGDGEATGGPRQPDQAPLNDTSRADFTRTSSGTPGAWPGSTLSGEGSQSNPFVVDEGPSSAAEIRRRRSSANGGGGGGGSGYGGSMFSRMRDAFGGNSGGGGDGGGAGNEQYR